MICFGLVSYGNKDYITMFSVCFSACLSSPSLPTPPKGFDQKVLQFLQSQETRLVRLEKKCC